MKIDLGNKYFYYNKTVEFIFNELNKSSFLESKASRKNIGLIKWIYEKSPNICQGISFDEDNSFNSILTHTSSKRNENQRSSI